MKRASCLVLALASLAAAGCGFAEDDEHEADQDRQLARVEQTLRDVQTDLRRLRRDVRRQAGAISKQRKESEATAKEIATLAAEARSRANYDLILSKYEESIDEFWSAELPGTYQVDYRKPEIRGPYAPDEKLRCAQQTIVAPGNAIYCGASHWIGWDEEGLMYRLYREAGPLAPGFILAHEWGHAIQAHLGLMSADAAAFNLELELGADCLAGAWAGKAYAEGDLVRGDFDAALKALLDVGDDPKIEWFDSAAHGTAFERTQAFTEGFEGGAAACVPPGER